MIELEKKLNYTFHNKALLTRALTHSSYANERRDGSACNERLEFLGDSILGMIVAEHLYKMHPDMPEGKMTKLRAELVCERSLAITASELGLSRYLLLGKGEESTGGRQRVSINADAVESILAATYLDGGIAPVREIVHRYILSRESQTSYSDYKTQLQEKIQDGSGSVLTYELIGQSGPEHNKTFSFCVLLNGKKIGEGSGRTKKEAEQMAACSALQHLSQ